MRLSISRALFHVHAARTVKSASLTNDSYELVLYESKTHSTAQFTYKLFFYLFVNQKITASRLTQKSTVKSNRVRISQIHFIIARRADSPTTHCTFIGLLAIRRDNNMKSIRTQKFIAELGKNLILLQLFLIANT